MAFLRTVSRCSALNVVGGRSLTYSRSEQFLRQYGMLAAAGARGTLPSAVLAALNQRLALEGHPGFGSVAAPVGGRRWRSTSVAAASPAGMRATAAQQQDHDPSSPPARDPLDVSFNDPNAAFKSKTTFELIRAYLVYVLCSSEFLVENNMKGAKRKHHIPCIEEGGTVTRATPVSRPSRDITSFSTSGIVNANANDGTDDQAYQRLLLMKIAQTVLGEKLFTLLMKYTFYGHFVAGEDQVKIVPTLERLRSFGVKPILDYSVEEDLSQEEAEKREVEASVSSTGTNLSGDADSLPQYSVDKTFADRRYKVQSARTYFYLNEATCERNMETFLECLDAVKVSEVIMQARKYMMDLAGGTGNILTHHKTIKDLERYLGNVADKKEVKEFLTKVTSDNDGILHLFPWSGIINEDCQLSESFRVPDPVTGQMRRLISKIPPKEEEMFRNMIRRLNTIVKTAQDLDVRIMIDAEQTYFQPAISRITLEMMRKYNTEKAIVCTDLEQAKRQNFYFGAKLVRGAYIEQERARAAALGYEDPTNPSFEATTEMYHKTLTECLRRIRILKDANIDPKKIAIMVASHNEDTVRFAIEKMQEIGIHPEDKVICFGQLLGMCDYITFPLGQAGYSAYKYIPYGPVNEVLPYLSRRAQENKGVLQKIKKEKRLLLSEITKRLAKGQLFYTPKGKYVPI
ncbi:sluggish A [Anopheles darlingi]|uniref:Proline dehydrogenase n=1 Tax=Anopheles darlingi TaxID=43151 RepID=W5J477_ANODA|nr:sluggish A [Anopheles darlingi]